MAFLRKQMTGYLSKANPPRDVDVQNVGGGYDSSGDWQGDVDSFTADFSTRAILEPAGEERVQRAVAQHSVEPEKVAVVPARDVDDLEANGDDISAKDRIKDDDGVIFEVVGVDKESTDGWIMPLVEDEVT